MERFGMIETHASFGEGFSHHDDSFLRPAWGIGRHEMDETGIRVPKIGATFFECVGPERGAQYFPNQIVSPAGWIRI
jgi:hypothetical protein